MDSGVIISLILGGASIVSSICFGLVPSIRREKVEKLTTKVNKMAKDIKFFYCVEQSYVDDFAAQKGKNKDTIKKEKRAKIEESVGYTLSDYAKPSKFKQYQ